MSRAGSGDDAIYLDHSGECRDARLHKGCPARCHLAAAPTARRIRRKVSGQTKQDVKDKLRKQHTDLEVGVRAPIAQYIVGVGRRGLAARGPRRPFGEDGRALTGRSCSLPLIASAKWRCGS
jgi:hypothetical protein